MNRCLNSIRIELIVEMAESLQIKVWIDNIIEESSSIRADVSLSKCSSAWCLDEHLISEIRDLKSDNLNSKESSHQGSSADVEVPVSPEVSQECSVKSSKSIFHAVSGNAKREWLKDLFFSGGEE